MSTQQVIIALDQGTSSTRALAFDLNGNNIATEKLEITQYYPKDGYVEHCPDEIYQKTAQVLKNVMSKVIKQGHNIACLGITNQRETTVVWHKKTGQVIYNAIVWQDRRTAKMCQQLSKHEFDVKQKTGLCLDSYFSATKIKWLLDNVAGAQQLAENGELIFGTIDSYLIWRLTDGKQHLTDVTNASRTMLYNINKFDWDDELLELFSVPRSMLPEVLTCDANFGFLSEKQFGKAIPITGVLGDQQAALVGQQCLNELDAKITFGTGAFLMVNTATEKFQASHLLSTIAYKTKKVHAYAMEGSIFNAGTIVKWLREKQGLINNASESELMARSLKDNGGVYFVPAFTGLAAPYWQPQARGTIIGLQLDSSKEHLVRAGLEAVAYQTKDLIQTLSGELDINLTTLKIDGGMAVNQWLMQFIASLCQLEIVKPKTTELTALGVAMMAGVGGGLFNSLNDYKHWHQSDWQKYPQATKKLEYKKWLRAIDVCQYAASI